MKFHLTWSRYCVITNSTGAGKLAITETKYYVPVVTLSTQDNANLLQKLKSGFKRTINWNKYESNIKTFSQNRSSFQIIHQLILCYQKQLSKMIQSGGFLGRLLGP